MILPFYSPPVRDLATFSCSPCTAFLSSSSLEDSPVWSQNLDVPCSTLGLGFCFWTKLHYEGKVGGGSLGMRWGLDDLAKWKEGYPGHFSQRVLSCQQALDNRHTEAGKWGQIIHSWTLIKRSTPQYQFELKKCNQFCWHVRVSNESHVGLVSWLKSNTNFRVASKVDWLCWKVNLLTKKVSRHQGQWVKSKLRWCKCRTAKRLLLGTICFLLDYLQALRTYKDASPLLLGTIALACDCFSTIVGDTGPWVCVCVWNPQITAVKLGFVLWTLALLEGRLFFFPDKCDIASYVN